MAARLLALAALPLLLLGCCDPAPEHISLLQSSVRLHNGSSQAGSTCGMGPAQVPGCQRADMGSCGNACCALELQLAMPAREAYGAVQAFLAGGRAGYSYVPGEMPFNEHPPDDLTSLAMEGGWQFVFQGGHRTSGRGYNDTLNFNLRSDGKGGCVLRAFSISDLHGSLGDAGQNYKNLAFLLQAALGVEASTATTLYGCGAPVPTSVVALPAAPAVPGPSTCGLAGGAPDCSTPDMGACGNACCALEVSASQVPRGLYKSLRAFLESGGGDGSYGYVPGTMPFGEHPADDLTSLAIEGGWQFVVQGRHRTSGRGYNDTLNFNLRSDDKGGCVLRAFSVSDLHGSLGDAGQNFRTLAGLLDALGLERAGARKLYGCGA